MPSPGQGTLTREARGEATTLHPMWTGWTEGTCEVTPGVLDQVDKSEAQEKIGGDKNQDTGVINIYIVIRAN